jgi:hypothetical protein
MTPGGLVGHRSGGEMTKQLLFVAWIEYVLGTYEPRMLTCAVTVGAKPPARCACWLLNNRSLIVSVLKFI